MLWGMPVLLALLSGAGLLLALLADDGWHLLAWLGVAAPLLAVEASDDSLAGWWKERYTLAEYHERLKAVPQYRVEQVQDAGHMLHHDQPAAVARLIEDFCSASS